MLTTASHTCSFCHALAFQLQATAGNTWCWTADMYLSISMCPTITGDRGKIEGPAGFASSAACSPAAPDGSHTARAVRLVGLTATCNVALCFCTQQENVQPSVRHDAQNSAAWASTHLKHRVQPLLAAGSWALHNTLDQPQTQAIAIALKP
jgi:hypothetical protein